jgi:hypothetical protein
VKIFFKLLGAIVALFVVVMVVQMVASESGEVVVVTTTDAAGQTEETRLWVVDYDGGPWLRAGSPAAGWYQRMMEIPSITVQRGDRTFTALIQSDESKRDQINKLMNEKYGWADDYIGVLFGRDDAIPIQLVADES